MDFDVDGFGTYFDGEHAQLVNGFGPFAIQTLFVEHIFAFFKKGISQISADGVKLNIMSESGISINYKVACTNFCLLLNFM